MGTGDSSFPTAIAKGLPCILLCHRLADRLFPFLMLGKCMCSSQHGLQPTQIPTRVFSTITGAGGPEANTNCPVGPTWSCHNCCHGKAIRNPFSHGDDVRQDTVGLEAPEVRAQPSKPCLHLTEANSKLLETFKKCWFSASVISSLSSSSFSISSLPVTVIAIFVLLWTKHFICA